MPILNNVELRWAKVLGTPVDKYNPVEGREWSVDLVLTPDHIEKLRQAGVSVDKYVKTKNGVTYFQYTRSELKKDGSPSKRIEIVDAAGAAWSQDKFLGNGTLADIQYSVNELAADRKNPVRFKPSVIRILIRELVEYEGGDREEFDLNPEGTVVREDWSE